jgi:uncharacterized membrane protein YphA (DoxX/SURF4 family)
MKTEFLAHETRLSAIGGRGGAVYWCCLLLLCSAYLQGSLEKAFDFNAALAEMNHFGLEPAVPLAVLTIAGELVASFLVLTGIQRWLGAAYLALFTLMAPVVANRFWELSGVARTMSENGFFEHLGLAGAFVLVAWLDLSERYGQGRQQVGKCEVAQDVKT